MRSEEMAFDGRLVANVGVLAAIVESGSFARAADALGLSPSGVSRAIARLESSVGVRLLDRTTRSVTLTDEGRRLYGEIGPLLTGIGDAFTHTAGSSSVVRGRLRVSVDAFFSRMMFASHTGRFLERYPEIALELITREQLGDLVGEGFDIAIRFGQPPSSSLVARKLFETRTVTVASPSYIENHGRPTDLPNLPNTSAFRSAIR
jgi:DNA-binding transcriptional LysR family regulator